MRLGFTLLFNLLVVCAMSAQINSASTFPADLVITAPSALAGIYDYGTQTGDIEWGPRLSEDVSGELVWAFNVTDSLGCNAADGGGPILTDLTGKMAFIRRGACSFVDKVLNAQNAGAIGVVVANHFANADDTDATVFGMSSGDAAISDLVTIPAVFVSRGTASLLANEIDAGGTVDVLFDIKSFGSATTAWSRKMPLDNYEPYAMSVDFVNADEMDSLFLDVTAVVTTPSGATATVNGVGFIQAATNGTILMDEIFTPTELGTHLVTFSNNVNDETLSSEFEVTEFTYGTDNLQEGETPSSAAVSQDDYILNPIYQTGSLVNVGGDQPVMATFASFGLTNPSLFIDLDSGEGETFEVILYEGPFAPNPVDFDNSLTEVARVDYVITGEEESGELLYAEFDSPVMLDTGGIYYISVKKDVAVTGGGGVVPEFLTSNDVPYLLFTEGEDLIPATPLLVSSGFFTGGWNGANNIIRLHTDGFVVPVVDTMSSTIELLADNQISIAPNPVDEQLNLTLRLGEVANDVQVGIMGVDGRKHGLYTFDNVTDAPLQLPVAELKAGTYFLSIQTPVGYRMVKFIKQ